MAKIIIAEIPSFDDVAEKIASIIEDFVDGVKDTVFEREQKVWKPCSLKSKPKCYSSEFNTSFMPNVRPWGIAGEPKEDPNKIFGAGFEIDEPRSEDYDERWKFESDHAAFDRFVDAGEDCVARGLEKKSDAPIHKVKAIRKSVFEPPVMGVNLVGETHWW